ncbi:MAG: 50S ribosomal protein L32 [Kiritimatiellae bacterium]|nr:50S ribosomal protein L32 [Kiritimatiellia bacterium]
MAVPKHKKSKMRKNQRKGHIKAVVAQVQGCPSCGATQQTHRVCSACGMYNGRKVLTVAE